MKRPRHYCFECSKPLRVRDVVRFQGKDVCEDCLVVEWEPVYLEHYVRDGTTALSRAIEAGPTQALIHDIRISDYHSATEMYYTAPSMIVPPWRVRHFKEGVTRTSH